MTGAPPKLPVLRSSGHGAAAHRARRECADARDRPASPDRAANPDGQHTRCTYRQDDCRGPDSLRHRRHHRVGVRGDRRAVPAEDVRRAVWRRAVGRHRHGSPVAYCAISRRLCQRRAVPVWLGAATAWIGWFAVVAGLANPGCTVNAAPGTPPSCLPLTGAGLFTSSHGPRARALRVRALHSCLVWRMTKRKICGGRTLRDAPRTGRCRLAEVAGLFRAVSRSPSRSS